MKIFKQGILVAVAMTFWMAIALHGWSQGNVASPGSTGNAPTGNGQITLQGENPTEPTVLQSESNGRGEQSATLKNLNNGTFEVLDGGSAFLKSKGNLSIAASDLLQVQPGTRDNILDQLVKYNVTRSTFSVEQLHEQPHSVQDIMLAHPQIFVVQ